MNNGGPGFDRTEICGLMCFMLGYAYVLFSVFLVLKCDGNTVSIVFCLQGCSVGYWEYKSLAVSTEKPDVSDTK